MTSDQSGPWFHRLQRTLLDRLARGAAATSADTRARFGRFLGTVARDLLGIRRDYVLEQLQMRLGLSPKNAAELSRRIYARFFENAMEMASIPYLTSDQLLARLRPTGLDNLRTALAAGKGVILISGHYGLWEMIPPWLALSGFPVAVVVRRQNNRQVDAWMEFMRRKHGPRTTDSGFGLRDMIRSLRQGDCLGLMSDQDAGERGIFIRFLGDLASTVPGPAVISQKTGAPLLPLTAHPVRGGPHQLDIRQPIWPGDYPATPEGRLALTQAFSDIVQTWIISRPEQWFWLHRRWKTRPPMTIQPPIPSPGPLTNEGETTRNGGG